MWYSVFLHSLGTYSYQWTRYKSLLNRLPTKHYLCVSKAPSGSTNAPQIISWTLGEYFHNKLSQSYIVILSEISMHRLNKHNLMIRNKLLFKIILKTTETFLMQVAHLLYFVGITEGWDEAKEWSDSWKSSIWCTTMWRLIGTNR